MNFVKTEEEARVEIKLHFKVSCIIAKLQLLHLMLSETLDSNTNDMVSVFEEVSNKSKDYLHAEFSFFSTLSNLHNVSYFCAPLTNEMGRKALSIYEVHNQLLNTFCKMKEYHSRFKCFH